MRLSLNPIPTGGVQFFKKINFERRIVLTPNYVTYPKIYLGISWLVFFSKIFPVFVVTAGSEHVVSGDLFFDIFFFFF